MYDRLNITIILGLLIEPNKNTFRKLLNKNRNAIHINSCLSNTKKPQKVEFINPDMDQLGGVVGDFNFLASYWIKLLLNFCDFEKNNSSHLIYHIFCISIGLVRNNVKGSLSEEICLPLYSILLSIGNPTVDYFSLDVEGAEMGILESIPWDKVDIRVRIANIRFLKTSYRLKVM